MLLNDFELIFSNGFFYGYNILVWIVILNQALGGLLVAIVVRYSNQVIKGFTLSLAVLLSCIFSILFFNFQPSYKFVLGAILVLLSNYFYSQSKNIYKNVKSILPTSYKHTNAD